MSTVQLYTLSVYSTLTYETARCSTDPEAGEGGLRGVSAYIAFLFTSTQLVLTYPFIAAQCLTKMPPKILLEE